MERNFSEIYDGYYKEDVESISHYYDDLYDSYFGSYFDEIQDIYGSVNSKLKPISDSELEWILCDLPIKLYDISEALNNLRLQFEIIKLKRNEYKLSFSEYYVSDFSSDKKPKKAEIDSATEKYMVEHDLVMAVYKSLILRVENELSFSRELIMGAKKIWDSRRVSEKSNPVGEVVKEDELPEYDVR